MSLAHTFYALSPDRVLAAVEEAGQRATGRCVELGSLENRVYEVELEDAPPVIAKFYRHARWSRAQIEVEHHYAAALAEAEVPVCRAHSWPGGDEVTTTQEGLYAALYPRVSGRHPDELSRDDFEQLGRLVGRMHAAARDLPQAHARPELSAETYGERSLHTLLTTCDLEAGLHARLAHAGNQLIARARDHLADIPMVMGHADLHRGNLVRSREGFIVLDLDDSTRVPIVQDLWLLLPARVSECEREIEAFCRGYEVFGAWRHEWLDGVESLRSLRYLRYAAWIADRREDPAFVRAFPQWGSASYWATLLGDLYEQLEVTQ